MALFEKFFNSTKDLCSICDLEGKFIEVCDSWETQLGWPKAELIGKHVFDFVHNADRDDVFAKEATNTKKPLFMTYRFKNKNDDYRWLSWSFTKSVEDQVIYAIARDITDVRKYNLSLEALIGSLDDMIFLIDEHGLFIELWTANPNLLSMPKEEILGKTIRDVFGHLGFGLESILQQSLKLNRSLSMEFQLPGKTSWFSVKVTPVKNSPTKKRLASFLVRDITEKMEADQALDKEKSNFLAASKMATLGEMAAGVAHEINNPLAIIQGKIWLLKKQLEDKKVDEKFFTESLQSIHDTTERISYVVRGLKSFARNADNDPFVETPVATVIDEALALCRERIKGHGIQFRIVNRKPFALECRGLQISQVIFNLLSNSFDAVVGTPDPWIELSVQESDTHLEISVTDSGKGISHALQEKIMQPFFTTKEVGKGTGMGLSITKGIVESHNGQFFYDPSSSNTKFVLRLPKRQNKSEKVSA